jgi:hypothetical protein
MVDLQELILRGRFVMADAPERQKVFEYVNGKRDTGDIAKLTKRHINNVRRDLTVLEDAGLIQLRTEKGELSKKLGLPIYEKVPLARTIPLRYFSSPTRMPSAGWNSPPTAKNATRPLGKSVRSKPLEVPSESEVLDIAKDGESQIYEFKGQGAEVRKITREIAAMLNTRQGGIIFYGIDDDGNIEGSDIHQQKLDQPLQNSVRNAISPAATIRLHTVQVIGSSIIVIIVPPWNKKDVYQFDEKILIRKGTNVFAAKPEELRRLHSGKYVI